MLFRRLLPFGRQCELLAIDHVRSLGYRVVSSGFRTQGGEIDVIAWEGNVLVFIEVKARKNEDRPEDNVGFTKQRRLMRAAHNYLSQKRLYDTQYRFDIVAVTVLPHAKPQFRLFRDAFRVDE